MNTRRSIGALGLAVWALSAAAAGTPARDLGLGLAYIRVHELPRDLPKTDPSHPGSFIIDLRFAKSGESDASALKAWVAQSASQRTPVFVLENAATAPALLAAVPGNGPTGLIVLAPRSARIGPDIAVSVSPEADRLAYDALENGAPVESLLRDYPDKPRIDEAYLEKEHLADSDAPDIPTDKPLPPLPLVDAMLQRAVQLHRGLLALKKI